MTNLGNNLKISSMNILKNQQLCNYNTIKIGGLIKHVFLPISLEQIVESVVFCSDNKIPFVILAGGSNVVFDDDNLGYNQAVINLKDYNSITFDKDRQTIKCDCGGVLQDIVDLGLKSGSGTMVGLNRIPGTIGGAIVGNAGAYGTEIKDIVERVDYIRISEILSGQKKPTVHTFNNNDCQFQYRDSVFKKDRDIIVLSTILNIPISADIQSDQTRYDTIATKRDSVYPIGFRSPGSLFKNIIWSNLTTEQQARVPKDWVVYGSKLPVGRLLEELNLKGKTIGGIKMTDNHPNIMLNFNNGNYKDAINLVQFLQSQVKTNFGIDIEPEVRFLSQF